MLRGAVGSAGEYQSLSTSNLGSGVEAYKLGERRDVFDHDKFDIDVLHDDPNLNEILSPKMMFGMAALQIWVLFNALTTLMVVINGFKRGVKPELRTHVGAHQFAVLMDILTFFPIIFMLLVVLMFNNVYATRVFYFYLKRCALIDFPASGEPMYFLRHYRPLMFLLPWLAYVIYGIVIMLKFEASMGTIVIFLNNMAVGVGLFWYRQQSIESNFVSLSDFVQAFPDRDGKPGNIDEVSLHGAAMFIERMTLIETRASCYSDYMRQFWWKNQQYPSSQIVAQHVAVWGIIFALAGAAVIYFFLQSAIELKGVWTNTVLPCTETCYAGYTRGITVVNNASNTSVLANATKICRYCVCECLVSFSVFDSKILDTGNSMEGSCAGQVPSSCRNLLDL